jgi:hypothetical protein
MSTTHTPYKNKIGKLIYSKDEKKDSPKFSHKF